MSVYHPVSDAYYKTRHYVQDGEATRARIVQAIIDIAERGYIPTVREITKGAGLSSTSTAHMHLQILVRRGRLKKLTSVGGRVVTYIPVAP